MPIMHLQLQHFRNLNAEFKPAQTGLNFIYGQNGSGKTSLLEAIYFLSHGKSFRSSQSSRLIQHEQSSFTVFAELLYGGRLQTVGVQRQAQNGMQIRINDNDVRSMTEIAALLPLRLIHSQSHQLFEGGPQFRRKFLDWGLFYGYDDFLRAWRPMERALKQRNTLLKERRPKSEIAVWSETFAQHAESLHALRQVYIDELNPFLQQAAQYLLPIGEFTLHYEPGYDVSRGLLQALTHEIGLEYYAGHTKFGPHRADFEVQLNGLSAKHFLSRGQQKLLICAMILAQGMLLLAHKQQGLIYLIDDLPAELDQQGREKLISLLSQQQTQIFITAIDKQSLGEWGQVATPLPVKMFHVEHQSVQAE